MEKQLSNQGYEKMIYRRCGKSGIMLPAVSLGLWHNFGNDDSLENARKMCRLAYESGIVHFDLANNYGPPPGSAEQNFGQILKKDFSDRRDELLISTKAGWDMWPGPYGNWGSKKYLVASLDMSLKRMGLDYVDIFYHHRPDPQTPLEETMGALDYIVRSGRALYVGISQYDAKQTSRALKILKELGTPCLIHQPKYNMFERWVEKDLLALSKEQGLGVIVFSPLAQGMLTSKYLSGIPEGSRASKGMFLKPEHLTQEKLEKIHSLNEIAQQRGQSLAQMAIAWVLRHETVTSALVGASSPVQIEQITESLENLSFSGDELQKIETILAC